jgi:uncharacterized cofD-like protein
MKKVVTIGGGTGHYTLLRGLKNYDIEISAIVSMADDGGSTGKLRDEFGYLPAGDLRRCFVALSEDAGILREVFEHRIGENCVGNMIIASMQDIAKEKYVEELSRILRIKGKVLPITIDDTCLFAETINGKKLNSQLEVSYNLDFNDKISKIWLEPNAFIFKKSAKEIRQADLIVICPGDLYGSIIPNFLVKGTSEAIQNSKAKKVYFCNLVTKQGTSDFKASDFVNEIEKYTGKLDYIILNTKKPTKKIVDKYKGEHSDFVVPDLEDSRIIKSELLLEHSSNGKIIARHNPEKTARIVMELT